MEIGGSLVQYRSFKSFCPEGGGSRKSQLGLMEVLLGLKALVGPTASRFHVTCLNLKSYFIHPFHALLSGIYLFSVAIVLFFSHGCLGVFHSNTFLYPSQRHLQLPANQYLVAAVNRLVSGAIDWLSRMGGQFCPSRMPIIGGFSSISSLATAFLAGM